jgi:hypothetical protein
MGSIIAPSALKQGMKFRIVFVTDGTTDAIHTDHGYYDGLVQTEAVANGLDKRLAGTQPVTWLALISSRDGTKTTDRLPLDNVPLFLLSADQIATGSTSLWEDWKPLVRLINQSPTAKGITGEVWTGTRSGGDCVDNPLGGVYRQECAAYTIGGIMMA